MKRALILGTGGLSRLLTAFLRESGEYTVVGYTDPDIKLSGTRVGDIEVIGNDDAIEGLLARNEFDVAFIGLGESDLTLREKLFTRFTNAGVRFPAFVHKSAMIAKNVPIGSGTIVLPGVIVNPGATIGANVVVFSGTIIEHDCTIGDHSYLSPGVVLSGGVRLGSRAFLGAGSIAIPMISVGDDAVVGAGTVMIRNVPAQARVVGVPARSITRGHD